MRRASAFALVTVGLAVCAVGSVQAQTPPNQEREAEEAQRTLRQDSASAQDVHPNDSPDYRGFLIQSRDGRSSLRIQGSLRWFGLYDVKGLQGSRDFAVYDIPVGPDNVREGRFYMEASQTRFGLEAKTRRRRNAPELYGRFETDFRGTNNTLRLRHAYATFRSITVGQTWTTAAHVSTMPTTVDVEGPNSAISLRSVQVRYAITLPTGFLFAAAAENPSPDDSTASSGTRVSARFPDLVARLRGVRGDRELQAAVIVRSLPYRDTAGAVEDVAGWGLALSGRFTMREDRDEVLFQGVWGQGISRYVAGLTGRGLDVTVDPATGDRFATKVRGAFVSYGHLVRPGVRAFGTWGYSRIANREFEPPDAFRRGVYVALSLFRDFPWGARVGSEVTWGRRVNKDGAGDSALRLQAVIYYDF
jgi:hypothetical protein